MTRPPHNNHAPKRPSKVVLWLSTIAALCLTTTSQAQTQPTADSPAKPAPSAWTLRELLVLQTGRYGDTANSTKLVRTTLSPPIKHTGRIKQSDPLAPDQHDTSPMPLGLITFDGLPDQPVKLRLTLPFKQDRFHAHWPSNGITGQQLIEWPHLAPPPDIAPEAAPPDHSKPVATAQLPNDWLTPLRTADDRSWFQSRQGEAQERFLLYDASFKFTPKAVLHVDNDRYYIQTQSPNQDPPPLCLLLKQADTGWTSQTLLPADASNTHTTADQPTNLPQALTPLTDTLGDRGYNAQEIDLALQMITAAGIDNSEASLIYLLPRGEIDRYLQLQVRPKPTTLERTTIVVVTNADPNLSTRINALLDDLASDDWFKRDSAQRELIRLREAALPKVRQLQKSKDPEVAFRIQQILSAYDEQASKTR